MFKKWLIKFLLIFMATIVVLVPFVNYAVDPYAENNFFVSRLNQKKYETNFNSAKVQFDELKRRKYILLFGTSRSHKISSKMLGAPTLNFSGTLYGEPENVYNFLISMTKEQLDNVTQIYYLLDLHTFAISSAPPKMKLNWQNSIQFHIEAIKNFSILKIESSIKTIYRNINGGYNYIDTSGSLMVVEKEDVFNPKISKGSILVNRKTQSNFKPDLVAFDTLRKINIFCKDNNIHITYFTPTVSKEYFVNISQDFFYKHRRHLVENIDHYYDLTIIESITASDEYFTDIDHMNIIATGIQTDFLLSDKKASFLVDKDNIQAKLNSLNDQKASFDHRDR
jgi:hypothetical protein